MDIGNCYLIFMRSMVGVVNIHSVLWDKNHNFNDDYNQYNSDIPHDGGYNHFELRNLERAYDLKDNGSDKGFSKGDLNPAMGRVKIWLIDKFGTASN